MKTHIHKILLLLFIITSFIFAQKKQEQIVILKISPKQSRFNAGSVVDLELTMKIKKGWHINANKPLDDNLIATIVTLKENPSFKVISINYPQPLITQLAFSEKDLALYEEEALIKIQIKVDEKFKGEKIPIAGKVQYQPCNDQTCLFPTAQEFNSELEIQ